MRRSTTAALVVVGAALAVAGVTTVPVQDPPASEALPPVVAADPVRLAAVYSSTRGSVGVAVEAIIRRRSARSTPAARLRRRPA